MVLLDASLLPENSTEKATLQSSFFIRSISSINKQAWQDGFIELIIFNDCYLSNGTLPMVSEVLKGMPIRTKASYLLTTDKSFIASLKRDSGTARTRPIVALTPEDLLRKLKCLGIAKDGVPSSLGGTWDSLLPTYLFGHRGTNEGIDSSLVQRMLNGDGGVSCLQALQSFLNSTDGGETSDPEDSCIRTRQGDSIEESLALMQEALDLLDGKECDAFVEAKERAHYLVKTETPFLRFLECENYDAWSAAIRLASYWTQRKALFGARAFFPLDQTGSGALLPRDVEVLASHYVKILPYDRQGRAVVIYNRAVLPDDCLPESILRALFYACQIVSETELSQKQSFVSLVMDTPECHAKPINMAEFQVSRDIVQTAMPLHSNGLHWICPLWLSGEIPSIANHFVNSMIRNNSTVHAANTPEEMVAILEELGLSKSGVPCELGGLWTEG